MQFYNDLPVFTSGVVYLFDNNDNLNYTVDGGLVSSIVLDTIPSLSLDYLLNLYNYNLSYDPHYYPGYSNITCITAEFGYIDPGAITGMPHGIVKGWKLFPKGYPYMTQSKVLYVNDDGSRIWYSNGFVQ